MKDDRELPRVFFYRRLRRPDSGTNGGNLKVRDCFEHFRSSPRWEPRLVFSDDTVWRDDTPNLWSDLRPVAVPALDPRPGDLLFFSGHDWSALPAGLRAHPPVPVLNIAQPRHVRATDGRRKFLRHPAIRIAKSARGAEILREYGVNGPLFTIPDTIDLAALPPVPARKDIDVLVLGLKQPELARAVARRLERDAASVGETRRIHLQLPPKLPTRRAFLELLARARIVACVPLESARGGEGFYLPALEAMALETLVVCPHSIGNVGHCLDGINCIVPPFTAAGIADGVGRVLALPPAGRRALLEGGLRTAADHDLPAERRAILDLADRAYALWSNPDLFLPSPPKNRPRKSWFDHLFGRS